MLFPSFVHMLLKRKLLTMKKPANTRASRSKQRQMLHVALSVWVQREKDMEVAFDLTPEVRAEKARFIRQEKAKLEKELSALDRGFSKQRAWSQGKLLY